MKSLWIARLILVSITVLIVTWVLKHDIAPVAPMTTSIGPTLDRIMPLSNLTTLKVDVADVLVSELPGHTGSLRTIVIVKGDVTLGVDLSSAHLEHADATHLIIHLPQPRVQSARLDHDHTRLLELRSSGLWAITPGSSDTDTAAINHAMKDAQHIIEETGHNPDLIARCRTQTEQVLQLFLQPTGQTIECHWQQPP